MLRNLSTGIEASATGESLNSGDVAVHPAARHRADVCQLSIPVAVGASIVRYRQGSFEGRGESRGMRGV